MSLFFIIVAAIIVGAAICGNRDAARFLRSFMIGVFLMVAVVAGLVWYGSTLPH